MPARKMFDFRRISDQAAAVIGRPVVFFRSMARGGGFPEPVAFLVVLGAVSAALFVLAYALGLVPLPPGAPPVDAALALAALIFIPLWVLLTSLIASALLFVLWRILGSRQSFETAYRTFAYTYAILPITMVLGIVPYLGFASFFWTAGLLALASVEVHRISMKVAYPVFIALAIALVALTLSARIPLLSFQRALLESAHPEAPVAAPPAVTKAPAAATGAIPRTAPPEAPGSSKAP